MNRKNSNSKGISTRNVPAVKSSTAGITLIALVVTIIVLIILAGISINLILGENGIITKAKEARIEQDKAQIKEMLELKKVELIAEKNGNNISLEEYIKELQKDDNTITEEKIDDSSSHITVGDYVFKAEEDNGDIKITYEGQAGKLPPRIQDLVVSSTTNSIEVIVTGTRADKYVIYIKEKGATEYIEKVENTTGTCEFKDLAQNKEYTIRVEAINKNGQDEIEVNRTTGEMANLTQSEVNYKKSDSNWTYENVTTTIEINTEKDITGYEIQYAKFAEGEEVTSEKLASASWETYETSGIVSTANETIYTRLYDGNNATSYTSTTIGNIDKTVPEITTAVNSTSVTTKGFTLNIGVQDKNSGLGKIVWYYKLSSAGSYTSEEQEYTSLNGTTTGTTTVQTKSLVLDNITNGTYTAYAVVYDVAGKSTKSDEITINMEGLAEATGATSSPEYWTTGEVTVTIPPLSGYTAEYQIGTLDVEGTWTPYDSTDKVKVSSNTTIYYRYNDGTNAGKYSSTAVSNIDTTVPEITTALNSTSVTTKGFTLNIGVQDKNSGLGKIVWYYKLSTAGSYTSEEQEYTPLNGTTTGATTIQTKSLVLDNITNGTYTAYAVVYDVAGKSTKSDEITINMEGLVEASGATSSPEYWTTGEVTVTIPQLSGYTAEYQIGTLDVEGTWTPYDSTNKVKVSSNTTIYYRYNDGTNAGKYSSTAVSNIDTTVPEITTQISSSSVTTKGFTLNIGVQDKKSGLGKIVWYYKLSTEENYTSKEQEYTSLNGTTTGATTVQTKTLVLDNITNGTYTAYAVVYDVAGKSTKSDEITINMEGLAEASGATSSPEYWTTGEVIVTILPLSGYTAEYQIGILDEKGTWTPYDSTDKVKVSSNTTIYYRYNDGINAGMYAAKTVSNIDTTVPEITTQISSSSVTTKGFTLNIGVQDKNSGLGKIVWYYKLSTASTYTSVEEVYTALNGSTAGTKTAVTKSKAFDNLTIGTYNVYAIAYDVAGNSTQSDTIEITINSYLADNVAVGDYVAYDTTNNYSYTSEVGTGMSHGNGYASQTFTSNSSLKWRVLSMDTSTKEVVLISEEPIVTDEGENFYMKGAIGYLYAEQELNEICKIYGYGAGANTSKTFIYETGDLVEGVTTGKITGSGARSINVEDINNITGVTPSTAIDSSYGNSYTHTIYYPTKTTNSGYSTSETSRTYTYTAYSYSGSSYISGTIYNLLFKNTEASSNVIYWLASRCVNFNSSYAYFYVRNVYNGKVYCNGLGYGSSSKFYGYSRNGGVRPVVYLKSTVQTSGLNSSGEWNIIDE